MQHTAQRDRARDRLWRTLERREETISGGVDLATAEPCKLPTNRRAIGVEQRAPAIVAERDGALRRFDDVREQKGQQPARRQQVVDERLDSLADRREAQCNSDQKSDVHELRSLTCDRFDGALRQCAEEREERDEYGGDRNVEDGAIDEHVDVVQPVAEDGDGDGNRQEDEHGTADDDERAQFQRRCIEHLLAVRRKSDEEHQIEGHKARGGQRSGVCKPLQLLALDTNRTPEPPH